MIGQVAIAQRAHRLGIARDTRSEQALYFGQVASFHHLLYAPIDSSIETLSIQPETDGLVTRAAASVFLLESTQGPTSQMEDLESTQYPDPVIGMQASRENGIDSGEFSVWIVEIVQASA